MKFESTTRMSVTTVPRETLYRIEKGESYWTLTLEEAIALVNRLKAAIEYEIKS